MKSNELLKFYKETRPPAAVRAKAKSTVRDVRRRVGVTCREGT